MFRSDPSFTMDSGTVGGSRKHGRNHVACGPEIGPCPRRLTRQLLPCLWAWLFIGLSAAVARDPDFHVYLCFGQSSMEGFPGIEAQDQGPVDDRFRVLAAVDFPGQGRKAGGWYPATPPLCRPSTGIGPADYFGRTLVAKLPKHIRVGIQRMCRPAGPPSFHAAGIPGSGKAVCGDPACHPPKLQTAPLMHSSHRKPQS